MNYLLDGNCSISNNLAENSICPFTIGRKNWLFSDNSRGAVASVGIYTLIETAKANGLSPMKYIQFIPGISRILRRIHAMGSADPETVPIESTFNYNRR